MLQQYQLSVVPSTSLEWWTLCSAASAFSTADLSAEAHTYICYTNPDFDQFSHFTTGRKTASDIVPWSTLKRETLNDPWTTSFWHSFGKLVHIIYWLRLCINHRWSLPLTGRGPFGDFGTAKSSPCKQTISRGSNPSSSLLPIFVSFPVMFSVFKIAVL